jgi:quercetin dioxygenase-like cupin family protein
VSGVRLERWALSDGELSERRLMRAMEHDGYEVAVYTYPPGTRFDWHEHGQDKCDGVLEGALRIEIEGGEAFDLGPGDRLFLQARTRHRAEVIGAKSVLSLDGTRWSSVSPA